MVDSEKEEGVADVKELKIIEKERLNYPTLGDDTITKSLFQNLIRMASKGTTIHDIEQMVRPFADPEGRSPDSTDRKGGDGIHRMATNDLIRILSAPFVYGGCGLLKHIKKKKNGIIYPAGTVRIELIYTLDASTELFTRWWIMLGEYNVLRGKYKIKIQKDLPRIRDGQEDETYESEYK
jgi:hypothetical protein